MNATTKLSDSTALVMKIPPGAEKISQQLNQHPDEILLFAKCLLAHTCYDLVPTSAKLIVFDSQLAVKKAFLGLIYNGVRAAPVWDAEKQDFVGMLTVSDFIRILELNYKSSSEQLAELEEQKIAEWRETLRGELKPFVWISPDASLFDAVKTLIDYKVHRLPVMNPRTGNVLYILTHKRVLKFLMMYLNQWLRLDISGSHSDPTGPQGVDRIVIPGKFSCSRIFLSNLYKRRLFRRFASRKLHVSAYAGSRGSIDLAAMSQPVRPVSPGGGCPMPEILNQTLASVKDQLGSYENIATVTTSSTIIEALHMFVDRRVSALPVVDADRHIANIYAKFDVISLAADKTYDKLDAPIREALEHRNEWFEGVKTCKLTDRIREVLYQIVKAEVHRLVVADENNTLIGVVSLSDLLNFLVLKPLKQLNINIDEYDPLAGSVALYQSSVQAVQSMAAMGNEQWSTASMSDGLSVDSGAIVGGAGPNGTESSTPLGSAFA